jgi:hypothetical protein
MDPIYNTLLAKYLDRNGHFPILGEDNTVLDKAYIFFYNLFFFSQVFVRELISNASDAIEKFRYLCMTGEKLGK